MRVSGLLLGTVALLGGLSACSSSKSTPAGDGGTSCSAPPPLANADFCSTCTFSASANPATCQNNRPLNACCAWVEEPKQEAVRAIGLHYFSSPDGSTAPNLDCLANPAPLGASKMVTLAGVVKLFSSGNDSQGVKIEIFKEGANGQLGDQVGTPYVTSGDDTKDPPQIQTWSTKCPSGGCKLRAFSIPNVPTETPLIIKTSDATGTGAQWSDLYDYNVYIANGTVDASNSAHYDASVVAATDVNTVASAAGGLTIKPDKGVIAGEVHDCADVRISGAMVDSDLPHEGPMFYFGENEADPLPDTERGPTGAGTSKLGLFGTLNMQSDVPIRLSAVVKSNGKDVLLGTYTVQAFPGAVTALSFRGRRPWQTK